MSLLNDMLRDISQRQQEPAKQEGYDSLFHASSLGIKRENHWRVPLIIFMTVFLAVLLLNVGWHQVFKSHKPVSPAIKPEHTPPAVVQAVPDQVVADKGALVLRHQEEKAAQHELIKDLLQQAERAISMDRLSSPVEDNAYGYYQKTLSLEPNNEAAKQGLENIATRYLAKAQEQQHLGNLQVMETYIQRARFVAPDFVREQLSLQMAPDINLPVENFPAEQVALPHGDTVTQADMAQENVAREKNTQAQSGVANKPAESQAVEPPPAHETIKPFKVAEPTKLEVAPNPGWKDEQTVQQAREFLQQGKQTEALALLKNAVATQAAPAKSAALLAEIYLQQQNYEAAHIILTHAAYLSEATVARLNALALSGQGDNPGAITLLEQHLASAENDEDYRALLASLYHKTGNYSQSIINYQRLLSSFGEKPAYWLGLALAYDGLQQYKNALQAYLQLRQFAQLQPQVAAYVDQRIAALRSQ